jgi:hypothetical protein
MVKIRFKRLADVFPADDPLSNLVFRLAIIREDLAMEAMLLMQDELRADRGDPMCRRAYLARRHILTMHTARDVFGSEGALIQRIISRPENDHERSLGPGLAQARALLNKHFETLAGWRNDLGGHLDRELVLEKHANLTGPIEVPSHPTRYHTAEHYWRLPYKALMQGLLWNPAKGSEVGSFRDFWILLRDLINVLVPTLDAVIRAQIYRQRAWQ